MLVNYSFDTAEIANASHSVTLVPRLDYSINLLDNIIDTLQEKRIELKTVNQYLVIDFDIDDQSHVESIELEHLVVYSLEILLKIKNDMCHCGYENYCYIVLKYKIYLNNVVCW